MSKILGAGWWGVAAVALGTTGCNVVADTSSDEGEVLGAARESIALAPQDLCEFTVYSRERTDLRDRSTSSTGFIGSAAAVELGVDSNVTGHVRATGTVLMRDRSRVDGNVTAGGTVTLHNQTVVTGTVSPNTPVPTLSIPTKTVTPGTADVNVFNGQTRVLSPGNYRDLHAFAGSTLRLRTGVYSVRSFILEASSVRIVLDVTAGAIDINVQNELRFGNGMRMELVGSTNPRLVRYYSNWPNLLSIGTDLTLFGVVTAPNAEIVAASRTSVRGSLFGRRVTMDTEDSIGGACECGNGFLDPNEECDDGNTSNTDGCTTTCRHAICGDGFVHTGFEECDDGNAVDTDACTNVCASARCGDGSVWAGVEECDDGNTNDLDACENACIFRPLRRNFAKISGAERTALVNAIVQADSVFYADGVSYWDKQDQIHQATHVHGGPAFVTWHRELVNRYEALLRSIDSSVALHYWDWQTDPLNSPDGQGGFVNLFTPQTLGSSSGRADVPFDTLDNNGVFIGSRNETFNPADPPQEITRAVTCGTLAPMDSDANIIAASDGVPFDEEWLAFRQRVEGVHNGRHVCIGGTLGQAHQSFEDPFVFLLHSNMDRIWAMWQTIPGKGYRLDPGAIYGNETSHPAILEFMEPWAGQSGMFPWNAAGGEAVDKDSRDPSIVRPPRYDTLP